MGGLRLRDAIAALLIVLGVSTVLALPQLDTLRGVSIDVLTWLRWVTVGSPANSESPAVVVAVDEETYRTPPFDGTPIVTWTPEIARVLTAVIDGGAKAVGFDIIFPTSIEVSGIPFGDETLGEKVRGFDRPYLRALNQAARANKIVLGRVLHSQNPVQPSRGQQVAVRRQIDAGVETNLRTLNVYEDADGIIRRVPQTIVVDGERQPVMSLELAARALGVQPEIGSDGNASLAGYRIPATVPDTLTLNFQGGTRGIPTYSLADLQACLDPEKGNPDYFKQQFAGKVVLFGPVLDLEDRKLTSKRFATGHEGPNVERCVLPPPAENPNVRDAIPGVYIHATAVNNLLAQDALRELPRLGIWAVVVGFAVVAGAAAVFLGPLSAMLTYAAAGLAWTGIATWAFVYALVLPLIDPLLGGLAAGGLVIAYRFIVVDKDKRLLRESFALYLAPAVIEKMMASHKPPSLGGEHRDITVYFSDVAGFSSFSEKMKPDDLVTLMNTYLTAMTDVIEKHGGFVDKYIGDAIVAVFGAPLDDPQHALHAVEAALECKAVLEELNKTAPEFKGHTLGQRIGLHSGGAIVGNMGSKKRFNYTVMGDTVNLASRLEGANKYFATAIMASEVTMDLAGPTIAWRELDQIRVKGRSTPVKILEPLAVSGQESPEQKECAAAYAEGLACWRDRDFGGAMECFARVADHDLPSALFLERAKKFAFDPPGEDWEPVNTLEGK